MSRRPLSEPERRDWLRLARTSQVGPVTFFELIRRYTSPTAALEALPLLARRGGRAAPIVIPAPGAIARELALTAAAGGRVIAAVEPDFPVLLAALDPPPPVITVLGDARRLAPPTAAIVGARNASAIGRRFAHDIGLGVARAGVSVVSGLARGIDAAAHDGALAAPGITVAVVAGGADHVYPPENAALRTRIINEGALVSERALGVAPTARDFPRRNRLISGLSLGVVVIEAAERSGSLITARLAAEQGREVMAAPGSPLDPRAKGANRLIRDGAALIESADDVLAVLSGLPALSLGERDEPSYEAEADETELARAADLVRGRVLELLSPSPASRDEILRFAQAPAAAVIAALVELELAGKAVLLPGGLVALAPPGEDAPDLFSV